MGLPNIPIPNQFYDGDTVLNATVATAVGGTQTRVADIGDILEWPAPRFQGDLLVVTGTETNGLYAGLDDGDDGLEWVALIVAADAG